MTEPVLDQLNLVVRDMARSIDFYRAIGLAIPDDTVWRTATGPHHVEIKAANGFELAPIETGRKPGSVKAMKRIAGALGVPVDELV